jgi:hypothetical protein
MLPDGSCDCLGGRSLKNRGHQSNGGDEGKTPDTGGARSWRARGVACPQKIADHPASPLLPWVSVWATGLLRVSFREQAQHLVHKATRCIAASSAGQRRVLRLLKHSLQFSFRVGVSPARASFYTFSVCFNRRKVLRRGFHCHYLASVSVEGSAGGFPPSAARSVRPR